MGAADSGMMTNSPALVQFMNAHSLKSQTQRLALRRRGPHRRLGGATSETDSDEEDDDTSYATFAKKGRSAMRKSVKGYQGAAATAKAEVNKDRKDLRVSLTELKLSEKTVLATNVRKFSNWLANWTDNEDVADGEEETLADAAKTAPRQRPQHEDKVEVDSRPASRKVRAGRDPMDLLAHYATHQPPEPPKLSRPPRSRARDLVSRATIATLSKPVPFW